jgi:hypothetical protein
MKSLYLRSGLLALLCALLLSACGGTNGSLLLSGSITGLDRAGLVLTNSNNGEKLTIAASSTTFQFTTLLAVDDQFDVEVSTQPSGMICTPSANSGTASVYTVYYVVIKCVANQLTLGGTVSGLTGTGLILANGSDIVAVTPSTTTSGADVSFTFPTTVGDSASYGVTVLAQPAGQTCVVNNPTGTIGSANVTTLSVTCTATSTTST